MFAERPQLPCKPPSVLPGETGRDWALKMPVARGTGAGTGTGTGGAFDVLASVGLRAALPCAAPSASPHVGRSKGNEQHASHRARAEHDLRGQLRRAYKAAGVSQRAVTEEVAFILAGCVQAVRPATGRGVIGFGYRPVAGRATCGCTRRSGAGRAPRARPRAYMLAPPRCPRAPTAAYQR